MQICEHEFDASAPSRTGTGTGSGERRYRHAFDADSFPFRHADGMAARSVFDVLDGQISGIIMHGAVALETCAAIAEAFSTTAQIAKRGGNVPAQYVGAFHFGKDLATYLREAGQSESGLKTLLSSGDPAADFIEALRRHAPDTVIRVAKHGECLAAPCVVRAWNGKGSFSLLPHEDAAQLSCPLQAGFEIQGLGERPVVAVNICIDSSAGGELHYWNWAPSNMDRRALDIEFSGIPYPSELLDHVEKQLIPVSICDVYAFNGRCVHAVGAITTTRTTISFLMARLNEREIIYWA